MVVLVLCRHDIPEMLFRACEKEDVCGGGFGIVPKLCAGGPVGKPPGGSGGGPGIIACEGGPDIPPNMGGGGGVGISVGGSGGG